MGEGWDLFKVTEHWRQRAQLFAGATRRLQALCLPSAQAGSPESRNGPPTHSPAPVGSPAPPVPSWPWGPGAEPRRGMRAQLSGLLLRTDATMA